jgi:hypothetical protein
MITQIENPLQTVIHDIRLYPKAIRSVAKDRKEEFKVFISDHPKYLQLVRSDKQRISWHAENLKIKLDIIKHMDKNKWEKVSKHHEESKGLIKATMTKAFCKWYETPEIIRAYEELYTTPI